MEIGFHELALPRLHLMQGIGLACVVILSRGRSWCHVCILRRRSTGL